MKVSFFGASGGIVTGSCYLMEVGDLKVVLDCGMFQGEEKIEELNYREWPFNPEEVNFLILTHAHLDHTGLIPKFVKDGFKGRIISTDATKQLAEIIMLDAAKLQEEAEKRNESSEALTRHTGPLYTKEDVENTMDLFEVHPYHEIVRLRDNFSFRMREAGHILGSATVEIWFKNSQGRERKMVFSGDIGQTGARIIRDPDFVREADYVVVESTYGSRNHKDKSATLLEMLAILNEASRTGGNVIIPTFAVERAQEILYEINLFVERGVLQGLKFYLDSPLAIRATEIFRQYRKYYDEDAIALLRAGDDPFSFRGLFYTQGSKESMKLATETSAVIMAGSGMCNGGRVVHHLKNHLPNANNHVLFVGFQVPGTLGRRLVDGEPTVRIHGQEVEVKAKIHTLGGFSAHADQTDLLYWLRSFGHSPKEVFITHGDSVNREGLAKKVVEELQLNTHLPNIGDSFDLE
ncbi:MAG: MBL fold metallo-hydrolase [Candidatus Dojkabacteria bacterium]|nr:MAG: MBL fold metallo-hydrolase [Candidatus Dojkabacteria bacterium]